MHSWFRCGSCIAVLLLSTASFARQYDPDLRLPLTWPRGTYGFPRALTGCPRHAWSTGWRYHDTEDSNPANQWSNPLHLYASYGSNNVRHYFCMKTTSNEDSYDWSFPRGKYCIYKKGPCPSGLQEGLIHWDDEDNNNRNSHDGVLPDGNYNRNTDISFCCRTDGDASQPIYLPTDRPFILLANDPSCQAVHGMSVSREFFRWDTEDNNNADRSEGSAPTIGPNWLRLTFCYYYTH